VVLNTDESKQAKSANDHTQVEPIATHAEQFGAAHLPHPWMVVALELNPKFARGFASLVLTQTAA